jgi:hypothetical protein
MTSEIMDCGREVAKVLKLDDRWWAVEGRRIGSSDGVAPAADPAGRMASVMIEKALNMVKTGGLMVLWSCSEVLGRCHTTSWKH